LLSSSGLARKDFPIASYYWDMGIVCSLLRA
jgi:hypothetical protein